MSDRVIAKSSRSTREKRGDLIAIAPKTRRHSVAALLSLERLGAEARDVTLPTLDRLPRCYQGRIDRRHADPVSYTHLTLPTICSV